MKAAMNLVVLLVTALIAATANSEAAERPAWLSDEVVAAAMQIGMSEELQRVLNKSLQQYDIRQA